MNRILVLLVAGLLVLSGCSSLSGSPTESPTPTPTSTPTATPTPTPGPGEELAPGITREGIVNPVALMSAHERALLADGFVLNQTVVSTYDGSADNRLVVLTTSGPGGEVAYRNATSHGTDHEGTERVVHNSIWLNTTTTTSRHVEDGRATYEVRDRIYPPESLIWFGGLQRDIQFAATDYEVTGVDRRDGLRVVTLSASVDRVGGDGVVDTASTLRVDENGVIRYAATDVSYGEGTTYHTVYQVVRLDSAPPARPAWVDAVPPSAALDVGLDVFGFDATSIQLVHTHGDAAPAGSVVTVLSNGTLYETTLADPFRDGERYLWIGPDGTLRATPDRPAAGDVRPLGTEVTVTVRAPDGAELFSVSIGRR